jgi:hypothetical protein
MRPSEQARDPERAATLPPPGVGSPEETSSRNAAIVRGRMLSI